MSSPSHITQAKQIIREAIAAGSRPAVLSSFGKDSLALCHLVKDVVTRDPLSTHGFPLPVIYWRDPFFPHKHTFADEIIRSWGMEVHNYQPVAAGIKCNSERLELVARYSLGVGYVDVPKNTLPPEDYPRRDYLCGLRDWILRPKSGVNSFPWDVLLHGHKSSDMDPFEGHVPLRSDREQVHDSLGLFFPLRHWSDTDIWEYLEANKIPFQKQRYGDRRSEVADKWHNNDYTHACTRCIDPRVTEDKVFCPKLKSFVPNVGAKVLQLNQLAEYIVKEGEEHRTADLSTPLHSAQGDKLMRGE